MYKMCKLKVHIVKYMMHFCYTDMHIFQGNISIQFLHKTLEEIADSKLYIEINHTRRSIRLYMLAELSIHQTYH